MKITYYGHSCFGVEHNGTHLLFDPFISGNEAAKDINIDDIPADYILVTHGHQDHVLDVEAIAKRTGAKLISNFEIVNWFAEKGIENGHPLNHGGGYQFDFGYVKYVNAIHTSSMPDGSYGGNPGGFVVGLNDGANFYHSGDTALTYDMKLIGERYRLDFAMLCIGDNFTMGVEDAVQAAHFVGVNQVLGMHYDTFPPIKIDKKTAKQRFADEQIALILPEIGETIDNTVVAIAA